MLVNKILWKKYFQKKNLKTLSFATIFGNKKTWKCILSWGMKNSINEISFYKCASENLLPHILVFLERPGSFQNHRHRIKTQNRLQRQSKHIFVILFVLYSSQNMPKYFVLFCKQMFTGVCCYLNGSKSEVTVLCWVLPAKGLSWRQQNVKQVFKQVFKSIFVLWGSQQRELTGTRSGLFTQGLLFRLRKGSEITQAKNKTSGEKNDHMQ